MQTTTCFVAGKVNGNPGPGAIGVHISNDKGEVLAEVGRGIGNANADFAAYQAVMVGLETLIELFGSDTNTLDIVLCLDNEVVKKQLNAEAQITNPGLVPLFMAIHNVRVAHFPQVSLQYVLNTADNPASKLVMEVLDGTS